MKPAVRIISILLLAAALAGCFVPTFTFKDISIQETQSSLDAAKASLPELEKALSELIAANEPADSRKFKRAQSRVDEAREDITTLEQKIAESANGTAGEDISYSLFSYAFPEKILMNQSVLNVTGNVYKPNLTQLPVLGYIGTALLFLALLFQFLGGGRLVSKMWTWSSVFTLTAVLVLLYTVLRIKALPVDMPYSAAIPGPFTYITVLAPGVALVLNANAFVNTKRTLLYILCTFLSLLSIFPFLVMMVNATRSTYQIQQGVSLIPSMYLGSNWNILTGTGKSFDAFLGLRNSATIAFGSTALSVYFSALTAYGLTVYEFKGRRFLFAAIVGILMIPQQISNVGFFLFMYQLGWTDNYLPLILPAIAAPSTVFFMRQYLQANFQLSIVEAARIDGARELYTYNKVVMPILAPALATMGIFSVITSWNNYLTPLMMIRSASKQTLPMMVQMLRGDVYRTEFGSIYLGLTITALPLLLVYFGLSKYIIQGVALGGVKE